MLLVRHIPHRLKPKPQRLARTLEDRPRGRRCLTLASHTSQLAPSRHPRQASPAGRTAETIRPTNTPKKIHAGCLRREPLIEFLERAGIVDPANGMGCILDHPNILSLRERIGYPIPINQEIARDTLENAGYRVDVAANGIEALEAVQRFSFDVVLMDAHMPEMDGSTATRKIRELPSGISKIPIIALIADAMVGDREKFLLTGMNDYVSKPFEPEQLSSTIERWARREPIAARSAPATTSHAGGGAQPDSGLDSAAIEPLRVGKPDLWNRLVGIYLENTPDSLEKLDRALAADDCASAQMTAHTLKSSSANMGAGRLSDLCRRLEKAMVDSNLEAGRGLFTEICTEFDIVATALSDEGESVNIAVGSTA